MLETPHVAIGAAIAAKIPNPFISIPLAFLSHFAMDRVPHWNPHINTELKKNGYITTKSSVIIAVDVAFALILGSLIAYQAMPDKNRALIIMLGSFAAVLPDLVEFPYFFLKMKNKFLGSWLDFQKAIQVDTTPFWGLLNQFVTVGAVLLWLKN